MKYLNKQRLEKDIKSLFRQLESEGTTELTEQRFNSGLAEIFENSEMLLSGTETQFVSVLVADLRGFTAIVEKYSSSKVISILNEFFSAMVEIIDGHGGHVNKFMGDSVIAFFENTGEVQNDILNVLHCAIEMQIAMDEVNKKSVELGMDSLFMGISVNSGDVVASVLGSSVYRGYTIIGSTVNIASRIEAYTLRGQILLSDNTRQLVAEHIDTGMVNQVNAKGLSQPLRFYELLSVNHPVRLELPKRDNRRAPRIQISIPVYFQVLDGKSVLPEVFKGQLVDIGYGGMLIRAPHHIERFADIKMSVIMSPLANDPVDIYAKALYVQQKDEEAEVGLEFTIIDDETSAAVKTFVDNLM